MVGLNNNSKKLSNSEYKTNIGFLWVKDIDKSSFEEEHVAKKGHQIN